MGNTRLRKGYELNLRRLHKAQKLLNLACRSGHLLDRQRAKNPYICTRAAVELLDLAIETEEGQKGDLFKWW